MRDQPSSPRASIFSGVSAMANSARVALFTPVGGLRRQRHGDQQGEGVQMLKLALRIGLGARKRVKISLIVA
jgi:hypothetical protein